VNRSVSPVNQASFLLRGYRPNHGSDNPGGGRATGCSRAGGGGIRERQTCGCGVAIHVKFGFARSISSEDLYWLCQVHLKRSSGATQESHLGSV
jgi:hypothetical protein